MEMDYILVFLIGFLSCAFLFFGFLSFDSEIPFVSGITSFDVNAPSDLLSEEDIIILDDMVILKIEGASLSSYAPTGSMKPLFDKGANGIRIVPQSEDDINTGDIVSFREENRLIVHRVVEKGIDDQGTYFITKGDNNDVDDGKVRFNQIEFITVGVIW